MPDIKEIFFRKLSALKKLLRSLWGGKWHVRNQHILRITLDVQDYLTGCLKLTLKGVKSVVIFQDNSTVYGTIKEQFDKRMLSGKIQLREKNFTINWKKTQDKSTTLIACATQFHVMEWHQNEKNKIAKPTISKKSKWIIRWASEWAMSFLIRPMMEVFPNKDNQK